MSSAPDLRSVTGHVAVLCGVLARLDDVYSEVLAGRSAGERPTAPAAPRSLVTPEEHPLDSRFRLLADTFALTQVELDLLLLALAPELDPRYGDVAAALQADPRRRRPSVALAFDVLRLTPAQRLVTGHVLGEGGRLVRSGLLRLTDPPGSPSSPLPDRLLVADRRLARFVSGDDALDPALAGIATVVDLVRSADAAPEAGDPPPDGIAAQLRRPQPLCHLQGPEGSGRQAAAEALARAWGIPALLRVRTDRLPLDDPAGLAAAVTSVGREARLRGAAPYWDGFDVVLAPGRATARAAVEGSLGDLPHAFVSSTADWPPGERPAAVHLTVPRPDARAREVLWRRALGAAAVAALDEAELRDVAAAFRLGPSGIAAAAAEARAAGPVLTGAGLAAAARRRGVAGLAGEAQRVAQSADWPDLVLPPDRVARLRALGDRIRHRALVHDRWGFGATLGSARGVVALFTGPSGTGKTMAAGVVAASLGLELYRVDLAGMVSKYIGETEKNLARVFAAAEATDVVLFFDEADALFGKRTEVRDAHDRYANLEVAYLLQRIEEHDGVVVLATNLRKNLDEAFLRRLQFVVEFPLPDRHDRRRIWQRVWPAAAPLDPALDLDLLADRFELSGGSIRNVAVEAAFAAAADDRPIGPGHVTEALRHEHQKLGRVAADRSWAPAPAVLTAAGQQSNGRSAR